MTLEVLGASVE